MALRPRDPNDDRAFVREVDEEVRREAVVDGVRRYGWAVALGVLALLIAFGGVLWWRHEQDVRRQQRAETYVATLNDLDEGRAVDTADRMAPLLKGAGPGYTAAARLLVAAQAVQRGDLKAAAASYAAVATDDGVAQPFRDIALVRQTAVEFESLSPAEVERRLTPLARPGQPFSGSAGELIAHARLRAGRERQAGELLARIAADASVPDSLRSRATQLAGSIGVDAVPADPASASTDTAGPTP